MTVSEILQDVDSIFIDTAPLIYYLEAHREFGPIVKEFLEQTHSQNITIYSSVITITEVLSKPIQTSNQGLVERFLDFIVRGTVVMLIPISADIAQVAGELRGKHSFLQTMDALQISAASIYETDVFLTNDIKLKRIPELQVVILKDLLETEY